MSLFHPLLWLISKIGQLFTKLIKDTSDAYDELPQDEKDQLSQGVIIAQIIKTGYSQGATYIVTKVVAATGLDPEAATTLILAGLKEFGIDANSIEAGIATLADKAQAAVTNTAWNGLWQLLAKSVVTVLSGGSLNWVSLSLGLLEIAYQKLFGDKISAPVVAAPVQVETPKAKFIGTTTNTTDNAGLTN